MEVPDTLNISDKCAAVYIYNDIHNVQYCNSNTCNTATPAMSRLLSKFRCQGTGMTGCSAEITRAMARAIKSMKTKMGPITTTHINNTHGLIWSDWD